MILPRPFRVVGLLLLVGAISIACTDPGITGDTPRPLPFEEVVWAEALGIDTAAFVSSGALRIREDAPGDSLAAPAVTGDRVRVRYELWIPSGVSVDRRRADDGDPVVFRVGAPGVLAGLSQTVNGMRPGGARTALIPPAQGFGRFGAGAVPPESWLALYVELVAIDEET